MKLIKPLKERPLFFEGANTRKATFKYKCFSCNRENEVRFNEILESAWGWRELTQSNEREKLASLFQINLDDKSIASGMDAVVSA